MPVDRIQTRSSSKRTTYSSNRPRNSSSSTEIISIPSSPSDDEKRACSSKKRLPPKTRKCSTRTSRTAPAIDVIDILSSDEDSAKKISKKVPKIAVSSTNAHGKMDIEVLWQEHQRLKAELAELMQRQTGKSLVDSSELEDVVTCEICTTKMWSPYVTPNCGHSFCGTCLKGWFEMTLRHHLNLYPNYDVNLQLPEDLMTYARDPRYTNAVAQRLQEMGIGAHPIYTCPHCRGKISDPPTENRALKSVVRMASAAAGERSPKKPAADMVKHNERLWGKFFPQSKLRTDS